MATCALWAHLALALLGVLATPVSTQAQPQFEAVPLPTAQGAQFTTVTIGPDGKLYGTTVDGEIWRWPLNPDGTTGTAEVLTSITTIEGGSRLLIGMAFDPASTAGNLIAWVSHTTFGFSGMADWGGKITRLNGANLESVQDFVVGLPRSSRDHVTNGIAFGPDGALYFLQGSNSTMGAPDSGWALRPERVLTAAVLRLDDTLVTAPPLDAQTEDGGTYDPYAPGAPLTVYASGTRNAYDLLWHSNGQLYVPTNGSGGSGNTPEGLIGAPCADGSTYAGPAVPGLTGVGTQSDYLFRVQPGGYYGHPNPLRCQYVMNGGNPTSGADPAEVTDYPVGTNPDASYGGFAFDFGDHQSPDGVIEYTSDHFAGALLGQLLVARYSAGNDLIALTPGGPGLDIVSAQTGIPGFTGLSSPLDLIENTDNGYLYVSEYGASRITLLRPLGVPVAPEIDTSPAELIFSAVSGGTTTARAIAIDNIGTGPLEVTALGLVGNDPGDFQLVSPPATPFTIASGASALVNVSFSPGSVGALSALLRIATDDADEAIVDVGLYGLSAQGLEGGNEPPLHRVVTTLGHAIDVGGTSLSLGTNPAPIGDEVLVPLFQKAGVGNVTMVPVARYSPAFTLPFGWYIPNGASPITNEVGELSGSSNPPEHQTLFPALIGGTTTFDPGSATFGLYTTSPSHSAYTEDSLNALLHPSNVEHAARIYPLKDRSGIPIPHAYFVGFEEASNGDYQDYDFTIHNVVPAGGGPVDDDGDGFSPPADCDDTDNTVFPGAPELCDDEDDDCDGQIDEGNPEGGGACSTGLPGICAAGTLTCQSGGMLVCVQDQSPAPDDPDCDGIDDDCDGQADEDYVMTPTTCGVGACATSGQTQCVAGVVTDTCTPGAPAPETCNGVDDDCDGQIDDEFVPMPTTCGVGACAATGQTQCVGGIVIDTCTPGTPTAETCNGVDDDCDGQIDGGIAPTPTTCGLGACAASGQNECVGGTLVDTCTPGSPAPDDTTCDGVDDDCDGVNDEDFVPTPTSCGVGHCAATGQIECVAGSATDTCTPGTPTAETCNDLDDDCDGDVDEDNPGGGAACTTGLPGVCNDGAFTCQGGLLQCVPGAGAAETCDGLDNDCDGNVDEDTGGALCDTGVPGICADGTETCQGGALMCVQTTEPEVEVCDSGFDEDCDGTLDESECQLCRPENTIALATQTTVTRVRLSAATDRDKVLVRGTFALPQAGAVAPDAESVTVRLTDGSGALHYEGTIPAGSFTASTNGRSFKFRDSTLAHDGLRVATFRIKGDGVTTGYSVKALQLNQPPFSPGTGTVTVKIGDLCFLDSDDACITSTSGSAVKCR